MSFLFIFVEVELIYNIMLVSGALLSDLSFLYITKYFTTVSLVTICPPIQIYYNIIDHILMLYIISLRSIYFTAGDLYLLISYTYFTQPLFLWQLFVLLSMSLFSLFFFNMAFLFSVWLIPLGIISSSSIHNISFLFMAE